MNMSGLKNYFENSKITLFHIGRQICKEILAHVPTHELLTQPRFAKSARCVLNDDSSCSF